MSATTSAVLAFSPTQTLKLRPQDTPESDAEALPFVVSSLRLQNQVTFNVNWAFAKQGSGHNGIMRRMHHVVVTCRPVAADSSLPAAAPSVNFVIPAKVLESKPTGSNEKSSRFFTHTVAACRVVRRGGRVAPSTRSFGASASRQTSVATSPSMNPLYTPKSTFSAPESLAGECKAPHIDLSRVPPLPASAMGEDASVPGAEASAGVSPAWPVLVLREAIPDPDLWTGSLSVHETLSTEYVHLFPLRAYALVVSEGYVIDDIVIVGPVVEGDVADLPYIREADPTADPVAAEQARLEDAAALEQELAGLAAVQLAIDPATAEADAAVRKPHPRSSCGRKTGGAEPYHVIPQWRTAPTAGRARSHPFPSSASTASSFSAPSVIYGPAAPGPVSQQQQQQEQAAPHTPAHPRVGSVGARGRGSAVKGGHPSPLSLASRNPVADVDGYVDLGAQMIAEESARPSYDRRPSPRFPAPAAAPAHASGPANAWGAPLFGGMRAKSELFGSGLGLSHAVPAPLAAAARKVEAAMNDDVYGDVEGDVDGGYYAPVADPAHPAAYASAHAGFYPNSSASASSPFAARPAPSFAAPTAPATAPAPAECRKLCALARLAAQQQRMDEPSQQRQHQQLEYPQYQQQQQALLQLLQLQQQQQHAQEFALPAHPAVLSQQQQRMSAETQALRAETASLRRVQVAHASIPFRPAPAAYRSPPRCN